MMVVGHVDGDADIAVGRAPHLISLEADDCHALAFESRDKVGRNFHFRERSPEDLRVECCYGPSVHFKVFDAAWILAECGGVICSALTGSATRHVCDTT